MSEAMADGDDVSGRHHVWIAGRGGDRYVIGEMSIAGRGYRGQVILR